MSRSNAIRAATISLVAILATPIAGISQQGTTNYDAVKPQVRPSETGSYIVVMTDVPLIVSEGRDGLKTPAALRRGQALARGHDQMLQSVGAAPSAKIESYTTALNGFAAFLDQDAAQLLAGQRGVAFVVPNELRQLETDASPDFLGLAGKGQAWSTQINGKGVVVGVVDSGIWPEHPSFADDGSFKAPHTGALPCEFGNTAFNNNDAAFTCNNKLIGAQQFMSSYKLFIGLDSAEYDSARDDDGHGTHTASTAAGNSGVDASIQGLPLGTISGIAPKAHVSAYKACGRLGCFTADLAAAIDQAVADGVDVINYSIGSGPSGPGGDELAFLFAADAGVFVATSAGNSGSAPMTVGSPGVMPWVTTVAASTQPRFFEGEVVLGDGSVYTGASITGDLASTDLVDAAAAGGDLCIPGTLNPAVVTGKIVLCRRGAIARVAKSNAVFAAGGVGTIIYENSDEGDLMTDTHFTPTVHMDNTPGLAIKAYIAGAATPTASFTKFTKTELDYAPSITSFSSRGPNAVAPDIIKPDITAPGIQILAGYSPTPDPATVQGDLFAAIAGTSMSSPHIAGLLALIKQANPDWSPAMAKSALMTSANPDVLDSDRTSPADPFDFGAGHADLGRLSHKGSSFRPGLAYDAGFAEYLGFMCDAFPSVFASPASTCATLAALGVPTVATDLNYPSIGVAELAGVITVKRTVTGAGPDRGARVYIPTINAPPGYTVSVSPRQLRVLPGAIATYELTITNKSAPVGQWRFGEIVWSDTSNQYAVRSPIAVNGSELGYPEIVIGSGESGATSFDVRFGYTGDYAAAPHGLVPATVSSDTVVQDPNQTFNPNDGYSNLHSFNLSGVRLFRIAMPPEATETGADLDIYVFGPGFFASSTAGGTDELIDIPNPADGTWSVYVHGWSTPGGDSAYDLYTWAVPEAASLGNLTIDSAPSSATVGTVGTVNVAWTGATAGTWNLGAVSHNRSGSEIGLTLVEVDNR